MQKILLSFIFIASFLSVFSQGMRCPQCPPSPVGHAGEFLSNDGTFLEWSSGGGVTTATNGTEYISTGVIGLGGALSRDTTHIEMNPYNQIFAIEDSTTNKYHFIIGEKEGDGVPWVYGYSEKVKFLADTLLHLAGGTAYIEALDVFGINIAGDEGGAGDVLTAAGDGSASWQAASGGSGWGLTGNSGTTAGTNFIGTTDNVALVTKTQNTERTRLYGHTLGGSMGGAGITYPSSAHHQIYNYRFDSAAISYIQVENQTNGGAAALFFGGVPNTVHGSLPANNHYAYIGLFSPTATLFDTTYQGTWNFSSGSGQYRGVRHFTDLGTWESSTTTPAMGLGHDLCIAAASDTGATTLRANRGFVGIGTANPQRKLTIYGGDAGGIPAVLLQNSTSGQTTTDGLYISYEDAAYFLNYENTDMRFYTNGAQVAEFTNDGKYGFGTTTMNRTMNLYGGATNVATMAYQSAATGTGSTDGGMVGMDGTDLYMRNYENGIIYFGTNNTIDWTIQASGTLTAEDANNIAFGTTTGTKIGTATSQKLGFWNATPIVQPTTAISAATFTANSGTAVNDASTFDGYTLGQIVKALRNAGLLQ